MSLRVYKHYCGIKRGVAEGTNGRVKKTTISTANKCLVIPMPSRAEIENGFSVGTGYDIYFPSPEHDVKAGDQVIWNTKVFNVRRVAQYDVPRVGHTHALTSKEGS